METKGAPTDKTHAVVVSARVRDRVSNRVRDYVWSHVQNHVGYHVENRVAERVRGTRVEPRV